MGWKERQLSGGGGGGGAAPSCRICQERNRRTAAGFFVFAVSVYEYRQVRGDMNGSEYCKYGVPSLSGDVRAGWMAGAWRPGTGGRALPTFGWGSATCRVGVEKWHYRFDT